jgi:hypothetical protein
MGTEHWSSKEAKCDGEFKKKTRDLQNKRPELCNGFETGRKHWND